MDQRFFNLFNLYRAFFPMAVIIWHTQGLGLTEVVQKVADFHISYKDILYFNVFLVAVPLFIQISLFLYLKNRESKSRYFLRRSATIGLLLVFWAFCAVTFNSVDGFKGLTISSLPMFLLTGGNSFFYFFSSLFVVTVITEISVLLRAKMKRTHFLIMQWMLLILSTAAITFKAHVLPYLSVKVASYFMPFWSPVNFLPLVFSSLIIYDLYKTKHSIKSGTLIMFVVSYIASVILEWKLTNAAFNVKYGYPLPNYERPSLVIISALLLLLAIYRDIKLPKIFSDLSALSLGVFCLHPFVMGHITRIIPYETLHPRPYLYFIGVYVVCLILVYVIKKFKVI